jgi:soluble lytic murein transglycosylase-like protein
MIAALIRCLALAARAHAAWPEYSIADVTAASCAAVGAADPGVPAELLLAIAQHESDLHPNAVSWVATSGRRVDILWTRDRAPPENKALACGYGQTIVHTSRACADVIADHGGLVTAEHELAAWLRSPLSGGSLRVALGGYAGGIAGARAAREGIDALAVRFADLFIARARRLTMQSVTVIVGSNQWRNR